MIVDLNLLTASPTSASAWVTETQRVFPPGSIIGYEVVLGLDIPATKPAQVQHLLAPSVRSPSEVTLAGQTLGQNGKWSGPRDIERVTSQADHYSVTL